MLGKQKRVPTLHVHVYACELIKPTSVSVPPMLKPAAFANPTALSRTDLCPCEDPFSFLYL